MLALGPKLLNFYLVKGERTERLPKSLGVQSGQSGCRGRFNNALCVGVGDINLEFAQNTQNTAWACSETEDYGRMPGGERWMNTVLREFFDALNDEEKKFVPVLQADNLGIMLRAAINELDWYSYNLGRSETPTEEQQEHFYLLNIGVPRLIKIALEARPSFDAPTVTFRRSRQITLSALQAASGLGMIEHGRRVAQTVMSGLCEIQRLQDRSYLITLPPFIPDDDYYERAVFQHYRSAHRDLFYKKLFESELGPASDERGGTPPVGISLSIRESLYRL
jgi:hypothetical protein